MCNLKMAPIFVIILTLFASCDCNKYSAKMNVPEYNKLDKPFRMQKLNLIWERAQNKLPAEKLKSLHTDLKFQDKEELAWKKSKAEGYDKSGLKEGLILASFTAILEKYNLQEDYKALEDSANLQKSDVPEMPNDVYMKNIFRDKKLNKLWLKAEQQGFSESQLQALKEEFQHHQNKIDQYYQMMNQLHAKPSQDDHINTVEHILEAEVGQKMFKSDNPHQMLKEKHQELKSGYDYLNSIIHPDVRSGDFEEPKVNVLWELAKNTSFSIQELESLKKELQHFEHRIKKLKTLASMESEHDDSNIIDEVAKKKAKKFKEYNYKVEKIQKDLTARILQKHAEL